MKSRVLLSTSILGVCLTATSAAPRNRLNASAVTCPRTTWEPWITILSSGTLARIRSRALTREIS